MEWRQKGGSKIILKGINSKEILSCIKKGFLGLASDQNAGIKGMRIPFFGKELSIPKGAAYFYHKTHIPIIIGFCMLNNDYTYSFSLKKMSLNTDPKDIEKLFIEIGTVYNTILESEIRKAPEQYFWFHKKWDRKIYT